MIYFLFHKASSFSRSLSKRDVALQNLRESYAAFMTLVKPIAVKRVSGTEENRVVRDVSGHSLPSCVASPVLIIQQLFNASSTK